MTVNGFVKAGKPNKHVLNKSNIVQWQKKATALINESICAVPDHTSAHSLEPLYERLLPMDVRVIISIKSHVADYTYPIYRSKLFICYFANNSRSGNSLWKWKPIKLKTNMRTFNYSCKSVILYFSDSWREFIQGILYRHYSRRLRRSMYLKRSDKVNNGTLWNKTHRPAVEIKMEKTTKKTSIQQHQTKPWRGIHGERK